LTDLEALRIETTAYIRIFVPEYCPQIAALVGQITNDINHCSEAWSAMPRVSMKAPALNVRALDLADSPDGLANRSIDLE